MTLRLEQYLGFERVASRPNEYVHGKLRVRPGKNQKHCLIVTNLICAFHAATRDSALHVMANAMKVILEKEPLIVYYPDVLVIPEVKGNNNDYVTKPCLIVEVLSEDTEHIDKTEKKINYQRLESLEAYLIVHQNQKRIDVHRRISSSEWTVEEYGPDAEIELDCPKMTLKLEDVYKRIQSKLEEEAT
jgi:Uma2 family endonuclease